MRMGDNAIVQKAMTLVWTTMAIVFCAAGILELIEDDPEGVNFDFLEATFFVIVTMYVPIDSTVYGKCL